MSKTRKGKMRAWLLDEFDDCDSDEERDALAWAVPDVHGILNPECSAPVEDLDEAAEKFAAYFYAHRDGWESSWPLEFVIHDGSKFYKVQISMEMTPSSVPDARKSWQRRR